MCVVFETIPDEQLTRLVRLLDLPTKSTDCNLSRHTAFETYAS